MRGPQKVYERSSTGYGNVAVGMTRNDWACFCLAADKRGVTYAEMFDIGVRFWFSITREDQVRRFLESKAIDNELRVDYQPKVGVWKETWAAICSLNYPHATTASVARAIVRNVIKITEDDFKRFQFDANMGGKILVEAANV